MKKTKHLLSYLLHKKDLDTKPTGEYFATNMHRVCNNKLERWYGSL